MSRAPQHYDAHSSSLANALTPFGVIDFVDNHCLQASAASLPSPAGIVGGPPAYLEAHGIRYVPQAILESSAAEVDSKSAPAPVAVDARPPVSHYDIESRVDDRVRQFMRERAGSKEPLGEPYRVRGGLRQSAADDYDLERVAGRRGVSASVDSELQELRRLRMEVEAANGKAQSVRSAKPQGDHRRGPRRGKGKPDQSVDF